MSEPVTQSTIENYLSMFVLILRILYETLVGTVKALMPIGTMPRKSVRGQVVLITGSGSGIGRLMAVEFGQLGARLVLWDVNEQGNLETKKILEEKGIEAHAYTIDLSRRDEIYRVANEVKSDVGTVDILVNNAGIVNGKNFLDTPDEAIERIMTVNATSMFFTTKAFLGDMVAANQGHVVIIASMAGKIGNAQLVDYSASKFAAVGFAEALSAELYAMGKSGVHITNICPYFINTGMFDGVQTLSPIALPILEPKYVVENIMEAVLTNKPFMALPKTCYFLMFLASFMPAKTADLMRDLFGVSHTMKNFKGRTNKTE